jgi:hypothetical protein
VTRWLWVGGLVIAAGTTAFFLKGPHVTKEFPFALVPFEDFYIRAQDFSWGLGEEDFQIQVPVGGKLDQIAFGLNGFHRKRIQLANWGIATTYAIAVTGPWLYLFENSGALLFNGNGSHRVWCEKFSDGLSREASLDGPAFPSPDGSVVVFVSSVGDGEKDTSLTELVRIYPEQGKQEVLLSLPQETNKGLLERFDLPNGFIAIRRPDFDSLWEPAQYYDLEGKPQHHPLAIGLNLLHQHKIDLYSPGLDPEFGAFYPSQTKDAWGLFPWKDMPNQTGKNLFLLSVTDTVQAVPVTCEKYSLEPQESLTFVLVHPKLNLFLLGARLHRNDDSVMMYLGRVRKDSAGKIYRAETYRVKYFPEVESPIFSRNGQVLLFASRMPNGTNLVFAHLTDIVADVNRRYPDAKFDLEELK